jgi:hypothetical protein
MKPTKQQLGRIIKRQIAACNGWQFSDSGLQRLCEQAAQNVLRAIKRGKA